MIKAKEVSLKNIAVLLAFSLVVSAGYFVSKSHMASSKNVPIFMGEEIIVKKAEKAKTAVMAEKAITAVKAETIVKAQAAPLPAPKVAVPLPIVPPSITFKVLPVYPASALEKGREGIALLSVYVGLSGQPEKIEVKTSSGIAELDDSALKAVSQWKFSPAAQGGQALASWFEIPVRFELK